MIVFLGLPSFTPKDSIGELQEKLYMLEQKTKEAERVAELAEIDAKEKDKELIETLKRMRDYETVYDLTLHLQL